jgi:putative DNA methylase
VEPIVEEGRYHFKVKVGAPKDAEATKRGTSASKWNAFRCLLSDVPVSYAYIRSEATAGRMSSRLMAIVAEGVRGRIYLSPTPEAEATALQARPVWSPELEINYHPRDIKTQIYGLTKYGDLFTSRQLVALNTFSELVGHARERVSRDALAAGMADDGRSLASGGNGATAYADAIAVYLGMSISKMADAQSALCRWKPSMDQSIATFGRQALPMVWDFSEANAFSEMAGDPLVSLKNMMRVVEQLPAKSPGHVSQVDAQSQSNTVGKVVSTDPPYYDNIGYADLSDFFYVWLRRTLKTVLPDIFTTLAVPKAEELVATPYRHGSKEKAEAFFLHGMTRAMERLSEQAHPAFPVTVYYAFKQTESDGVDGNASTGWETFLDGVIRAGFAIGGTWPMRTELGNRMIGAGSNALASSIVLVCRKRGSEAQTVSRREFVRELNAVLPDALDEMTKGSGDDRSPVAPVDLSQAIIGPGMAVFSKYAAVLEANGEPMSVKTALQLINRFLAEDDFDPDTRFCLRWFEENGWKEGSFGGAETLSRAQGTSVDGVKEAGVIRSGGGKVRLLKWSEYPSDWDPKTDTRNPVWETVHHLIRALKQDGEAGAGKLLAAVRGQSESVRQLAYRLYTLCERQAWAEDARGYNEFITSWTGIESAVGAPPTEKQGNLCGGTDNT